MGSIQALSVSDGIAEHSWDGSVFHFTWDSLDKEVFFCALRRTWRLGRIMKLPNAHRATVSRAKILGYLLSDTHPRGKSKGMLC